MPQEDIYTIRKGGEIYAQGPLRNLGYDAVTLRAMAAAGYIMYCRRCPMCGAYLDPGEICDCQEDGQ